LIGGILVVYVDLLRYAFVFWNCPSSSARNVKGEMPVTSHMRTNSIKSTRRSPISIRPMYDDGFCDSAA
jgi:hypothetical protein